MKTLDRIIYLAVETRLPIPNCLKPYIIYSDMINGIIELGIEGYCVRENISSANLLAQYQKGKEGGTGTEKEYTYLVSSIVAENVADAFSNEHINLDVFMAVMTAIDVFKNQHDYFLHESDEYKLSDDMGEPLLPTKTGIIPIDYLIGGFVPNSLVALAGGTGLGKTRQSLGIGLALMESKWASSLDIYQLELSPRQQRGMLAQPKKAYPTLNYDNISLIHRPYNGTEMVRYYQKNPDYNKVVIVDGIDHIIAAGGSGDNRDKLGKIYSEMKRISNFVKLVIVTTQVNRQASDGTTKITNNHFADSALKAWQIDLGLAIYFPDNSRERKRTVIMTATKTRDQSTNNTNKIPYVFDYVDFRFSAFAGVGIDEDEY